MKPTKALTDKRSGYLKHARDDRARDDVKAAFGGTENKGPAGNQKKSGQWGTKTKERMIGDKMSPGRTPKV